MPSQLTVYSALILVQILFAINYVTSKIVVTEVSPFLWAFFRVSSATVMIGVVLFFQKAKMPPLNFRSYLRPLFFFSVFGVFLNQTLFLLGLRYTTSTNSSIICSLIPVFAIVFLVLQKKESLSISRILGFFLAMTGVLVLKNVQNYTWSSETSFGDVLTLLNAMSFGFFLSISKEFMQKNHRIWATFFMFLFASVLLFGLAMPDFQDFKIEGYSTEFYGSVLYGVVGATVVTYFLNNWSLAHTNSSNVALFICIQPALTAFLAWQVFSEPIEMKQFFSMALIFMGLVFSIQKSLKPVDVLQKDR